jgi:hypothetical protein
MIGDSNLDKMTKQKASSLVNKIIDPFTKGIFSDNSWRPVHQIFRALDNAEIKYFTIHSKYQQDANGNPSSKTWLIEIPFVNNRSIEDKLYLHIVCSGAGSVNEPLDRYDVVAYAN